MKRIRCMVLIVAALTIASEAEAHAFLERAVPAVGSTIGATPPAVELRFNVALEPAFSTVRVVDRTGSQVDRMDNAVDSSDRTLLRVSLPALPTGTYNVVWRAVSVDSHTTQGSFTFEVAR